MNETEVESRERRTERQRRLERRCRACGVKFVDAKFLGLHLSIAHRCLEDYVDEERFISFAGDDVCPTTVYVEKTGQRKKRRWGVFATNQTGRSSPIFLSPSRFGCLRWVFSCFGNVNRNGNAKMHNARMPATSQV